MQLIELESHKKKKKQNITEQNTRPHSPNTRATPSTVSSNKMWTTSRTMIGTSMRQEHTAIV